MSDRIDRPRGATKSPKAPTPMPTTRASGATTPASAMASGKKETSRWLANAKPASIREATSPVAEAASIDAAMRAGTVVVTLEFGAGELGPSLPASLVMVAACERMAAVVDFEQAIEGEMRVSLRCREA